MGWGGGQTDKYRGKNVCDRQIEGWTNRRTDAQMNRRTPFSLTDKRGDGRTRRGRRDERGTQWRINHPRGP
jgi:hypothetical protein